MGHFCRQRQSRLDTEHFLTIESDRGQALRTYSAREMAVSQGETVEVLEEVLGWAWVRSKGVEGWVPLSHLRRV